MSSWAQLQEEIEQWQQPVEFWWRDDDAIADTPALQTMLALAKKFAITVHLAVIPNQMQASLAVLQAEHNQAFSYVLQHGVEHSNYAHPGQRKIELGGSQNIAQLQRALALGRAKLKGTFGDQYLDILVPPWNRIQAIVVDTLPDIGYRKLSILGSPKLVEDDFQLNVHIDIINWKRRCFAGEAYVLEKIISHLRNKRNHLQNASGDLLANKRPCGLMTHHLDHDLQCWQFIERFFSFCQHNANIKWCSGEALYSL